MPTLITSPNIADVDGVYQTLIDAHQGLSAELSMALNARLILILINHIGDASVIRAAIDAARNSDKI